MKMYLRLVKALIAGVEPSNNEKKRNRVFYYVMSVIAIFGIMLPMGFFVGVIMYALTNALFPFGTQENAIELFLHLISAFSFVFGLNVIFTVFYFSGDIENLLPLPLRPYQIIGSKFTAALISESVMEFLVIMAAFAGYIIGSGVPFYSWAIAVIGMLTMPVLPLIYCGIICMLVMFFTRFVKNKDTVNKITGLFTFLLILGIVILISRSGFDTQKLIAAVSTPDNTVIMVMNCIFPQVPFLVRSMSMEGLGILNLVIYIVINVAAVALFMLAAQGLYFGSVTGVGQGSGKKKDASGFISRMKLRPVSVTYFKKELRLLVRTPAYFTNCFMINLMWPVLLYLVFVLQGHTNFLDSFIYGIYSGNEETVLLYILCITAASVLVTAVNCIASSALTREGKHFAFIKYIPVPYITQINVKALLSIIVSGAGMLIYVIAACVWLKTSFNFTAFCCFISLLSVTFATYLGIYMDSVNPKLVWDDELNALRGNYNIFFNMALAIVLEAVICAGAYLLFRFTGLGALMIIIILTSLLMVLTAAAYLLCRYKATKNIDELGM